MMKVCSVFVVCSGSLVAVGIPVHLRAANSQLQADFAKSKRLAADSGFSSMRIAYLECFSGISGDMFLGALVDAGVLQQVLHDAVAALHIGAQLEISHVIRSGISATKVDVWINGEKDLPREEYWRQQSSADAAHSMSHEHSDHVHGAGDSHSQEVERSIASLAHPTSHKHGRHLADIRQIISAAAISNRARNTALVIFEALGEAEAKIHNTSIDKVHFHEVGAVDAMVDIVCAAVGAEALGVDEFICSPLNVGGGTVKCAHGVLPVPAPATLLLLAGAPVYSNGIQAELVTPTGAAIVKTLASRFASFPEMKIEKSGYGAGSRDFPAHPNVMRLTIGETSSHALAAHTGAEMVSVLEANLDDLNPQVFGYVIDRLLEQGALDTFGAPVQMKKNRPGMILTVLCKPQDAAKLTQLIFRETTTLGVRCREERRQTLSRRWEGVETLWGEIRIKIASMNGTDTNYAPEYEDCRRVAAEHHVPLKQVIQEATRSYLASSKKH